MRTIVGVVVGFVAWLCVWMGCEMVLSAIWPEWFGAHQRAFQAAITNGAPFTPDTTILLIHIVSGSLIAALSGLMKAMLSWSLVPVWYHVAFSLLLLVMAAFGGRAAARRV